MKRIGVAVRVWVRFRPGCVEDLAAVDSHLRDGVKVRVRVRYVFEPLMTTGIEPGSERFYLRPWLRVRVRTFF